MKTYDLTESLEKRKNHIVNILILALLYLVGYWIGKKYYPHQLPYMTAYALPSLVTGLVFCKRFSDLVWMKLHPKSVGRVNVYYYDTFPILGIIFKYFFYMIVGFVIFPVYTLRAVISVVWLTFSINHLKRQLIEMDEITYYDPYTTDTL